ncbi:MAG TPA: DUF4159 domain-containing protein [Pirellulaceae bacterium]|nr:DUF4159 domain-containing protein [Pirellulaceae bacterium]
MSSASHNCGPRFLLLSFISVVWCVAATPAWGQRIDPDALTAEQVRQAIVGGVQYLKRSQMRDRDGAWQHPRYDPYPGGLTALCALALMNCGEPVNSPEVSAALRYLERHPSPERRTTYAVSLRIMALTMADPQGLRYRGIIEDDVRWLVSRQTPEGPLTGGWSYGFSAGLAFGGDSSNSQFVLLALHEAAKIGIAIDEEVWRRARRYWERMRHGQSGGFCYSHSENPSGSMTAAGVCSLIIIEEHLADPSQVFKNGRVDCCRPLIDRQMIEQGFQWLGMNFAVTRNPGHNIAHASETYYYLYGMERAGRLAGLRFFGKDDWYRAGASHLVAVRHRDGSWPETGMGDRLSNTAFSLLFLAKGRRPIVFGKYQYTQQSLNWDLHPAGVHRLSQQLESAWQMTLNWQTIRADHARVEDLNEAPVLFISGRDAMHLSAQQKSVLRAYVEAGGFIFAEACQGDGCGEKVPFDQSFRDLMAELFPESQLEPLGPEHPIWTANFPIKPNPDWPLLGLQACCRTSVVYCPRNLSCYWQLDYSALTRKLNDSIRADVEFCRKVGINVAAYATGRELHDKLERPPIVDVSIPGSENRMLLFPKLSHSGGADDAPNAWRNLQIDFAKHTAARVHLEKRFVSAAAGQLDPYPILLMHGRTRFQFSPEERVVLRQHFERDGFLLVDAICASKEFTESFRKEMQMILPESQLMPISADHPMWTAQYDGFDIRSVAVRTPNRDAPQGFVQQQSPPRLEGIEWNGRLVVVFSPLDLSCALENAAGNQCHGYTRQDAARIGINVLLYWLNGG